MKSVKTNNKNNQSWFIFDAEAMRGDTGNPMYTPEKLVEDIKEMVSDSSFSF